ncbi:MAG: hypothetical protein ACD_28C00262G0004 [uncultured bacterium]|nr:MAG: hypothetical protein ACD_28C00262G0004 [uncultured bacterium]
MMYGANGYGLGYYAVWIHLHWIFAGLALFGFIAALLWLYKYADKKMFLNTVWIAVIAGALGVLFTASTAAQGIKTMIQMMWGNDNYNEQNIQNYNQEGVYEGNKMMNPAYQNNGQATEENNTNEKVEPVEQ